MSLEAELARLRQQMFSEENKRRVLMEMREAFLQTGDRYFLLRDEELNAFLEDHWRKVERALRAAAENGEI